MRVLGQHSCKLSNSVVAAEAGEEGDGGVDHALGLGDHDSAAAEAGEPMTLAGMVTLEPVRLVLADVEPALRDRFLVGGPVVGAVEARVQRFTRPRSCSRVAASRPPHSQSTSRPEARSQAFQIQSLLVFF